jgi:hypothetical protein
MELIIFIAFVVLAVLLWNGYVRTKKTESDNAIDKWIPGGPGKNPDQHPLAQFNKSTADVAGSQNRVEAPAPTVAEVTAENKATAVAKVKKAPAKKTAAKPAVAKKPAAAKKAPAKKKST